MQYLFTFLTVIVLMMFTDIVWVLSMRAITAKKALLAGVYSALTILFIDLVTVDYINNKSFIVAAMLGCFLGTFITTNL